MEVYHTLAFQNNGEENYLYKLFSDERYTNDVSKACLFETIEELPLPNKYEYSVRVLEDEDGNLRILPDWSDEYQNYLIKEVQSEAEFEEDKEFCKEKTLKRLGEEELKKLLVVLQKKNERTK